MEAVRQRYFDRFETAAAGLRGDQALGARAVAEEQRSLSDSLRKYEAVACRFRAAGELSADTLKDSVTVAQRRELLSEVISAHADLLTIVEGFPNAVRRRAIDLGVTGRFADGLASGVKNSDSFAAAVKLHRIERDMLAKADSALQELEALWPHWKSLGGKFRMEESADKSRVQALNALLHEIDSLVIQQEDLQKRLLANADGH